MIDDDEIYPTDDDYRRLFLDRQRRFVELVPQHARAAREEAMSNLRTIVESQLGHPLDRQVDARIVADVVGDIAEISVAFELTGLNQQEILLLVRSFAPEPDVAWEWSDSLAGRRLRPGEIAFS